MGLRVVPEDVWQDMLDLAKCRILSTISNRYADAYLLSESSMFVYPHRVVLKTCGTTTLLNCAERIVQIASEYCGLDKVENSFYSRKDYMFPEKQLAPHQSFKQELEILTTQFGKGTAHVFGSSFMDRWYLYASENAQKVEDQTIEILMTELDPNVMRNFYKTDESQTARQVTEALGIADLMPGAVIDDFLFDPCGYSMNALLEQYYFTIHITPQSEFSYVSFETNLPAECHCGLVSRVVQIFRPGRFTTVRFSSHDENRCTSCCHKDQGVLEEFVPRDQSMHQLANYELHYNLFSS